MICTKNGSVRDSNLKFSESLFFFHLVIFFLPLITSQCLFPGFPVPSQLQWFFISVIPQFQPATPSAVLLPRSSVVLLPRPAVRPRPLSSRYPPWCSQPATPVQPRNFSLFVSFPVRENFYFELFFIKCPLPPFCRGTVRFGGWRVSYRCYPSPSGRNPPWTYGCCLICAGARWSLPR